MIVVADTSPLNYLILIHQIDVLPTLFQNVIVPLAVEQELMSPLAPVQVRDWMHAQPAWLEVRPNPGSQDTALQALDAGECEAIALAETMQADRLMIDEVRGRAVAMERGLQVIGTLGVLRNAARAHLLDLPDAIRRLQEAGFYVSKQVLESVLRDAG